MHGQLVYFVLDIPRGAVHISYYIAPRLYISAILCQLASVRTLVAGYNELKITELERCNNKEAISHYRVSKSGKGND